MTNEAASGITRERIDALLDDDGSEIMPAHDLVTIDLTECDTPEDAARTMHAGILAHIEADRALTEALGMDPAKYCPNPECVIIRAPGDEDESWAARAWHVLWEEGPYDWAMAASEGGRLPEAGPTVVMPHNAGKAWIAEPGFSFSLCFSDF